MNHHHPPPTTTSSSTITKDEPVVMVVSDMAENLIGSEIIKLAGEVKEKMTQGHKIYNLTIGDFDSSLFPIPTELQDLIVQAYHDQETNYPAANGMPALRESVSGFLASHAHLEYASDDILIAGGARPLIYAVFQTLVDPGDVVVFPLPSWNNNHYTHLSRATAITIETSPDHNFMPTASDMEPHIHQATLIALCSPLNPTGTVFTKEGLRDICNLILQENDNRRASSSSSSQSHKNKKPVYLLFDQIYWTLTHGDTHHVDPVSICPRMKDYTIYIDGLSKAFAATGVRVGWAFGPRPIISKMTSILGHVGAWSPKAEQVATATYLRQVEQIQEYQRGFKHKIFQRLQAFYQGMMVLKQAGHKVDAIAPQAAIYLTVKFDLAGMRTHQGELLASTEEVTQFLLQEAGLAIVPFFAFGTPKTSPWYRLSVGTAVLEEIGELFVKLGEALTKLTKSG